MSSHPTPTPHAETIWTKAFIRIFLLNVIMSMGQFIASTLLPKHVEQMGAPASVIGVVAGMFAITAIAIRPVVGPATGCFRKERLLVMDIGIIMAAFLIYGLSESIPVVMAGRLLHGVGMGFMAPVMLYLASNALPESKMASGIGVYTLGQAASTAIGPSVGLALSDAFGYNVTFFLSAALLLTALIVAALTATPEPPGTGVFRIRLSEVVDGEVALPALIMFFLNGSYACISSFLVVYGGLGGVENIGLYFTAYAISVFVSRPLSGRIADKYGMDRTIIPGFILFALSFLLVSFSNTLPMFILSGVVSAFGFGICQPGMQALAMKLVPRERRSIAGNTLYLGVDAGFLVMPALAGSLVTLVQGRTGDMLAGYEMMYRVMIVPILIALGLFLLGRKRMLRGAAEPVETSPAAAR